MTKTIVTLNALCYALNQAYNSHINMFCELCNETEEDRRATLRLLATEIILELEEAGMTNEDAEDAILHYDAEILELAMAF